MLTIEELKQRLLARMSRESYTFANQSIHLVERSLPAGTEIQIGPNQYQVPQDAFLVVIDEDPGAYWTHPVRYELHEVESYGVTVIHDEYPLETQELKEGLSALHVPDLPHLKKNNQISPEFTEVDLGKLEASLETRSYGLSYTDAAHKHALFVTGMDNMVDFRHDFVNMRNILIQRYGYDPSNIVVAMGDGSGYPDLPVDYEGTVADLDTALDQYAAGGARELGRDDTLFLYTFNHGGADGTNVYLCMHPSWDRYYDHQLLTKLNAIHCGDLIVAMNQCHSGGFVDEVLSTTGPSRVAIMTACAEDQSAHPAATGGKGYFSVVLYAALNWAFPASIGGAFPGYVAGDITTQDFNNDGIVAVSEAWQYVHDMMYAHHWHTINGYETPQWGESSPGISANMFWGRPNLVVEDGIPVWESPDVYLHDPAVVPTDLTGVSGHPAHWGDHYYPDIPNRLVARVHNTGCAPCRNATVEFRVMSFGVGGGTTLVGTYPVSEIEPGHHDFAWVDWHFSSSLTHRCIKVRVDCLADPALPPSAAIATDDNQAQRNLDPLYAAPRLVEMPLVTKPIERVFTVQNSLFQPAVFDISLVRSLHQSHLIEIDPTDLEGLRQLKLEPGETRSVTVHFTVSPHAELGEKAHFALQVRRIQPDPQRVGGVSFTVEVAIGQLEGRVVNRRGIPIRSGWVLIQNTKQQESRYFSKIDRNGAFSLQNMVPGPYRMYARCLGGFAIGSVFVKPNTVTTKVLYWRHIPWFIGEAVEDDSGNPLAESLITVKDLKTHESHLVRTDAKGRYAVPGLNPGEYEVLLPRQADKASMKAYLDFPSLESLEDNELEAEVSIPTVGTDS